MNAHGEGNPSDWITRWTPRLDTATDAPRTALDLACGRGRHSRWLQQVGWQVTALDRDAEALSHLPADCEQLCADIEGGPWPLEGRQFGLVVVTNYLWRPLWPQLMSAVAPGGWLLYETFSAGNASVGRPTRPDFLLEPGELLTRCASWQVLGYECGYLDAPARFVQRIAARRPLESPLPDSAAPVRNALPEWPSSRG
jgi:SAM-dependent methyltransferase